MSMTRINSLVVASVIAEISNKNVNKEFTREEFRNLLIESGISNAVIVCLFPWFAQIFKGISRDKPFYFKKRFSTGDLVVEIRNKLGQRRIKGNQYYHMRKQQENLESKIENAIKLLKENGFKVCKPVTTYEEI